MNNPNPSRILPVRLFALALLLAKAASALAEVHYVDVNSTNATPPYTNWPTAATQIQDAVDAAVSGDKIVVTNGTYTRGERQINGTTNRVAVDKPVALRSVNGPEFTTIDGGGSNRCVYLTNSASLSGFTLSGGSATNGGGVFGESVSATASNCVLTGNSALSAGTHNNAPACGGGAAYCTLNNCTLNGNFARVAFLIPPGNPAHGGGAAYCTLNSCTLTDNGAFDSGGGAAFCTLNNCTLIGNWTWGAGGGAASCALNNCIVYYNDRLIPPPVGSMPDNYDVLSTLFYCCTTPQPATGFGNITNAPLLASAGRPQPNSPCINAGNNSFVTGATDLDGNPRISGGGVDIGAYEYQWPQLTIAPSGPNVLLTWPTNNAGYNYTGFTVQSSTNLGSSAVWSTNSPPPVIIGGQNVVTNPITGAQKFYRLVQ